MNFNGKHVRWGRRSELAVYSILRSPLLFWGSHLYMLQFSNPAKGFIYPPNYLS